MAQELVDTLINTGGGAGGGSLFGFLMAKYLGNKTDKEIEDLKSIINRNTNSIEKNKELDSLRDTAIELLKSEMINHKETQSEIKSQLANLNVKLDEIVRLILNGNKP